MCTPNIQWLLPTLSSITHYFILELGKNQGLSTDSQRINLVPVLPKPDPNWEMCTYVEEVKVENNKRFGFDLFDQ